MELATAPYLEVAAVTMISPESTPVTTEVKTEVKPEVSLQPMPEMNPEVKPEVKTEVKTEKIKVGKNKKTRTVQVWIPCSHTRKQRSELQDSLRKTNLNTLKNYLKQRHLVKVGSSAPTNLLRQIYENAKAYGDVINENKQNLLHNYEKE